MKRALVLAVIVVSIAAGAVMLPLPSGAPIQAPFLGYVEAETLLVGAETGGRLIQLDATEGAIVAAQAPLFTLDALAEAARVTEATARLGRAKALLADLEAARRRPEQIEVLRASYRRAAANLELSRSELRRQRKLFARGMAAQALLDQARMAFERDRAALAQIARAIEA
ncbi:MAG: HlyD family secretion protein, partial [Gammaproteobacteria bacterium]